MFIKRPRIRQRSYSIVGNDGRVVVDDRIAKVNADLKAGHSQDELEKRMQIILRDLSGKRFISLSTSNRSLAEEIHKRKVIRKEIVRPEGALRALIRACEALGPTSIHTATEDELLAALLHVRKPGSRRHIIQAINEMLVYLKRDFTLVKPKKDFTEDIAFIRIDAFLSLSARIEHEYRVYLGALFATGCRFGELPLAKLFLDKAHITKQVREDGSIGPPKNRKPRTSPVLPALTQFVSEANTLGVDRLTELRLEHYYKIRRVCSKALGIRIHDLRHSYAVEHGAVGASTADIARYIGDTEKVCEDHYRNYCATQEEIERALRRFR